MEVLRAGVRLPADLARLILNENRDQVREAGLDGTADTGFLRTGILEAWRSERPLAAMVLRVSKLDAVAEGVETEAQAAFLNARGTLLCQGYLFGCPGPASDWLP